MLDTTINQRRLQPPASVLFVDFVVTLAQAAKRTLLRPTSALEAARRNRQARRELRRLSDRILKDIGLERDQVDRLFL